jgi:hypothetical protein
MIMVVWLKRLIRLFWLLFVLDVLVVVGSRQLAGIPHSRGNSHFWQNPDLQRQPDADKNRNKKKSFH